MLCGLSRNENASGQHQVQSVGRVTGAEQSLARPEAATYRHSENSTTNTSGEVRQNFAFIHVETIDCGRDDPMEPRFQTERFPERSVVNARNLCHPRTNGIEMRLFASAALALLLTGTDHAFAQGSGSTKPGKKTTDTAFAAMQQRGKKAMGVDQYTSIHKFDSFPDGGRIELQRDRDDSVGIAAIRGHIRDIAAAFKSGDFSTPEFVHMQSVPGTKKMAELRSKITYTPHDLPRGAELHIATKDKEALTAIHEFMAFQRGEHHAAGMTHPSPF